MVCVSFLGLSEGCVSCVVNFLNVFNAVPMSAFLLSIRVLFL